MQDTGSEKKTKTKTNKQKKTHICRYAPRNVNKLLGLMVYDDICPVDMILKSSRMTFVKHLFDHVPHDWSVQVLFDHVPPTWGIQVPWLCSLGKTSILEGPHSVFLLIHIPPSSPPCASQLPSSLWAVSVLPQLKPFSLSLNSLLCTQWILLVSQQPV